MPRLGTSPLADATALAALQADISTLQSNQNNLTNSVATGAGFPLTLAPGVNEWGAITVPLTLPPNITITNGHKYLLNGVVVVRSITDGHVLLTRAIRDAEIIRVAGAWEALRPGTLVDQNIDPDIALTFATDADRPEFSVDGAILNLVWVDQISHPSYVTVEFDGTISDAGPN